MDHLNLNFLFDFLISLFFSNSIAFHLIQIHFSVGNFYHLLKMIIYLLNLQSNSKKRNSFLTTISYYYFKIHSLKYLMMNYYSFLTNHYLYSFFISIQQLIKTCFQNHLIMRTELFCAIRKYCRCLTYLMYQKLCAFFNCELYQSATQFVRSSLFYLNGPLHFIHEFCIFNKWFIFIILTSFFHFFGHLSLCRVRLSCLMNF